MKNIIIVLTLFINITVFSQPYHKMVLSSPTSTDSITYYISDTTTIYEIVVGDMNIRMDFELVDEIPNMCVDSTETESVLIDFVQKGNLTDSNNKHKIYMLSILLASIIFLIYYLYFRN